MNLLRKLKDFFLKIKYPDTSFLFLDRYLAGIKIDLRKFKIEHYFISSLPEGILKPSFYETNIIDTEYLKENFKKEKFKQHSPAVSLLIPEASTKVFLLNFESLPQKKEEIRNLILWRINKMVQIPGDGVRLAWQIEKSNAGIKLIASLAGEKVVSQYEKFLMDLNMEARLIETPIFNLLPFVQNIAKGNHLIINMEVSYLTILGFNPSDFLIWRNKNIFYEEKNEIIREIDNTLKFLMDRFNIKIDSCWLRFAIPFSEFNMAKELNEIFSIPFEYIDINFDKGNSTEIKSIPFSERQLLLPLIGQTLWRNLDL